MSKPIGIFDSGIGGTSIWKEIQKLLPHENTVYLADSKHAPYGEKTPKEILDFSIKNTKILLEKECKIIVVACNTATTNAIDYLRAHYNIPFVGIEPAIKPAALHTKTKKVGVLATKGTLSSTLFSNTSKMYSSGIKIIEQEGKGLVQLIEQGKGNSNEAAQLLEKYMTPMLDEGIDCLVLGCTHYPYFLPLLQQILPKHVTVIDSGEAVAKQTKAVLTKNKLLCTLNNKAATHKFYSNLNADLLASFVPKNNTEISYLNF